MKKLILLALILNVSCHTNKENNRHYQLGEVIVAQSSSSISNDSTLSICSDSAYILFPSKKCDLGNVKQNDKIIVKFPYSNQGKQPLLINDIQSACGCTIPHWSQKTLFQGDVDTISVTFAPSSKKGNVLNSIYITSNAQNKLEIIRIKALVSE